MVGVCRRLVGGDTSAALGKSRVMHPSGDQVDGKGPHTAHRGLYCVGKSGREQA